MKRKLNIIIFLFWIIPFGVNAQVINEQATIPSELYSDRVVDEDGTPLNGIRIRVKGTGITAYTDQNGEFSINAKNGDVIILSREGRIINSYKLDGSVYYEVQDKSVQVETSENKSYSKISKKRKIDNTKHFQRELDSAIFHKSKNPILSVDFLANALNYANNKTQISESYAVLGDVYRNLEQYDLAVGNYLIAVDNLSNDTNKLKLANAYLLNDEIEQSKKVYNQLLKNEDLTTMQKVLVYEGLGDVYYKTNDITKSLNYYKTALTFDERTSNSSNNTTLNSKIAKVLEFKGQTEQAESYLLSSQEIDGNQNNPKRNVIGNKRTADFYSRNNSIEKEIKARQEILNIYEDSELEEVETDSIILTKPKAKLDLGNAYLKQNNLSEAITLFEESAEEAELDNDIPTQKEAIQKLSEAYVSLGDDDKALINYKKYVGLVDIIYKQKENEIKEALALSNELSEKQNRITSLEKDRELSESKLELYQVENKLTAENYGKQRIIIYSLIIGVLLLILSLFWMIRSNKQRKLSNNILALKSLRTQMNPHFIFNALNSVNNFIAQNDERTANRYLTDFSTLMRSVLENSEQDFISIEKEIELLDLYLKLEHSRFEDKFEYELLVDDTIELNHFQIPPMLLQPYVENAVWHGLRYKKEKGFLKVQLIKEDRETIRIEISDNGIGRKKSKELKTEYQKNKKSKGMQNIEQRIIVLNKMYKNKVQVFIEDLNNDGTGTKVILMLKK